MSAARLIVLLSLPSYALGDAPSAVLTDSNMNPVRKVVTLIEEMRTQVQKEADDDLAAYDKYMCFCDTNKKQKTADIADNEHEVARLAAFLEEAAAKEGELKTSIAGLKRDIADDQDALATALAVRAKEHEAFSAAKTDMKESIDLLSQATTVLAKVQLLQRQGRHVEPSQARAAASILLQIRGIVKPSRFHDVMQHDLFDVLNSLEEASGSSALRGQTSTRRDAAALAQANLLPWEKTEEQIGKEANPNALEGNAAGAKSYNARSGSILGLLTEMKDEFARDLSAAQKEELQALIEFQHLRAAKLGEIAAATKQKDEQEAALADLVNKVAQAKKDSTALQAAIAADQEFLTELEKTCTVEDEEYKKRTAIRSDEIIALGEALTILTDDASRDLFGKTVSLLQLRRDSSGSMSAAQRAAAQDAAKENVLKRLAVVAKRHGNWALMSLAVRVRLDAFTKVKEAMDKMMHELQEQQKAEYAKWERCKKDIDQTEDSMKEAQHTKEDLGEKHQALSNNLEGLRADIVKLQAEVVDMEISLKTAGEQRHEENRLFQTSISDQRATIEILQKALARLNQFYASRGAALVVVPGEPVATPPPKPKDYSKSAGAGGVIQLISKIISDAQAAEGEMEVDEQHAQEAYAAIVRDATASIEADRTAIAEKSEQAATTQAAISETAEAQSANDQELEKLQDLLKAHHLDCDYLLKYFSIRQQARAEEMDAITDAKAILSGANFAQ